MNFRLITIGAMMTVLMTALAIYYSLSGQNVPEILDVTGVNEQKDTIYLQMNTLTGKLSYDIVSDINIIDNYQFRKLTRFDSNQMYYTELLIDATYFNFTKISKWEHKHIEDTFDGASVTIEKNLILIATKSQNASIILNDEGKPIKLGDYTVIDGTYDSRPTKDIPSADISNQRILYDFNQNPDAIKQLNIDEANIYECFRKLSGFSGEVTRSEGGKEAVSGNSAYISDSELKGVEPNIYRTLSSIPECSRLSKDLKIVSFQGTYPPTLTDLYYDIMAVGDNFKRGYCGVYNWYDNSIKSINKKYVSPNNNKYDECVAGNHLDVENNVFDYCTGHSLGSARAVIAANNGYCKNVVTFAPPKAQLTETKIPITQYINLKKSDDCCDYDWSWGMQECVNKNKMWYSDIVPQVGFYKGDNYNPHFITIENGVRKFLQTSNPSNKDTYVDADCIRWPSTTLFFLKGEAIKLHLLSNY